jgi:hypothetical protein
MSKDSIKHGLTNIYLSFFSKDTRKDSYKAFKEMHYRKVYDTITYESCSTPEKAFACVNKIFGMKLQFNEIEEQYKLSLKDK